MTACHICLFMCLGRYSLLVRTLSKLLSSWPQFKVWQWVQALGNLMKAVTSFHQHMEIYKEAHTCHLA